MRLHLFPKQAFLLYLCMATLCSAAQHTRPNKIWTFGTYGGLDFTSGSPVPILTAIEGYGEGTASICDENGNLLFYTEGSLIWDRNHNVMPNGQNLTGLDGYPGWGTAGVTPTSSSTQACVIVPVPEDGNRFYVFSLTSLEGGNMAGRLSYSIVNMQLNGGNGDVEPGQKTILLDSGLGEQLYAVTGDRCNIWVIVQKTGAVNAFEITSTGINITPVVSPTNYDAGSGTLKISPDRKKIALCNAVGGRGGLILGDFNAATGLVSGLTWLAPANYYAACFSPDGSKLYVSTMRTTPSGSIFQYDLNAGSLPLIINSVKFIGYGFLSDLQLAPDGKIYFRSSSDPVTLGAITYPDLSGTAVQYVFDAVKLLPGSYMGLGGLPNEIPVFKKDTAAGNSTRLAACFKDSVLLQAASGGWDYTWSTGSTEEEIKAGETDTYTVDYYTPSCTYHSDTFFVKIHNEIHAAFDIEDITLCTGDTAYFHDNSDPGAGYTVTAWNWDFGNNNEASVSDTFLPYTRPGVHTIRFSVENNEGCRSDTVEKTLNVFTRPVVDAGPDQVIAPRSSVTLQGNIADPRLRFYWSPPNNLANIHTLNPIATLEETQRYYLTAINEEGCSSTDSVLITVFNTIRVPTAFTPNGDGLNDLFRAIYGENISDFRLQVYNRWGQTVFSSNDIRKGWDGTLNGARQPSGIFVWIISYADPVTGEKKSLKGTVMLIR